MLLNVYFLLLILLLRCCGSCGRVLEDYFFAEEPTFVKNAAGQVIEAWQAVVVFWGDNFTIDRLKLQDHVTEREAWFLSLIASIVCERKEKQVDPTMQFYIPNLQVSFFFLLQSLTLSLS